MEFDKLKQVIASVLNVDPDELRPEMTFLEDLGADSLDIYQIMLGIENEFDIELDPEKVEKLSTVEDALKLLQSTVRR